MKRKLGLYLTTAILAVAVMPSAARADQSITIGLTQTSLAGLPGNTLTFTATLTNTSASTIFLNGDSSTLASTFLKLDDNPFLTNASLSLGPGASSGPFAIFTVFIAPGTPVGVYDFNNFTVLGGPTGSDFNSVGSANFSVSVLTAPEPGTLILFVSGLAGIGLRIRSGGKLIPKE